MNRIKELRQARGWRQQDLAEKMNTVKSVISRYEKEQLGLDAGLICDFCNLFGVTADYLLGRSSEPYAQFSPEDAHLVALYHELPFEIRQAVNGLMAPYDKKEGSAVS